MKWSGSGDPPDSHGEMVDDAPGDAAVGSPTRRTPSSFATSKAVLLRPSSPMLIISTRGSGGTLSPRACKDARRRVCRPGGCGLAAWLPLIQIGASATGSFLRGDAPRPADGAARLVGGS